MPSFDLYFDANIPLWFYPFSYKHSFLDANLHILTNVEEQMSCDEQLKSKELFERFVDDGFDENEEIDCGFEDESEPQSQKILFSTFDMKNSLDESLIHAQEKIEFIAPNLIPSEWSITALTLSEKHGIGLSTIPVEFKVFKEFHLKLFAPKKLKVFEIGLLEILLFNHGSESLQVYVEFQYRNFKVHQAFKYKWTESDFGVSQNIEIPPESLYRLYIEVTSEKELLSGAKIVASTPNNTEEVESQLNFVANSVTENYMKLINLDGCNHAEIIELKCPKGQTGIVSVIGDLMGVILSNLDDLVKSQTGSALETLNVFATNVLLLDYLVLTDHLTPVIKTRAVLYLQQTFQKLLMFRNSDGSFREFREITGSDLWLTTYVIKFLRNAQRYLTINDEILSQGLSFISSHQNVNGEFSNENDITLTSFITATLDEFSRSHPQYKSNVERSVKSIEQNFELLDVYSLAFSTHLLFQTYSEQRSKFFKKFTSFALKTSEHVFWRLSEKESHSDEIATAYGLLIYDQIPELYSEAFKILSWLITKKSSGFSSIHASLVGLEAISKFATRFSDYDIDLKVTLGLEEIKLKNSTKLILHKFNVRFLKI